MRKNGGDMHMSRRRDLILEHFTSAEEAGEFWDTHSDSDYRDELEAEELEFEIQKVDSINMRRKKQR
jgi:hypothetical protein